MKPTDIAYLAGVIDSDGTIGIKRNTYSMRIVGDSSAPTYSERVCVKQVEPHAVDMLTRIFSGYRFTGNGSSERAKRLQGWQVTDRKAAACLTTLLPFLRIKRQQAENCLALRQAKEISKKQRVAKGRGHAGAAPRSAELSTQMEQLYERARELNRVGV
jgi:hypothetical protein